MAGSLELSRASRALLATLLAALGAAGSVAGCRESPTPQPPKAVAAEPDSMARAREAMDRGEHAVAVGLLRDLTARRPTDLEAHYRLGVSASHLDQPDEASQAFEWVVAHGEPEVPMVRMARDWLRGQAGLSAREEAVPPAGAEAQAQAAPKPERASLAGRAVGPEGVKPRLSLYLKGLPGTAVHDEYHALRTDQHGHFLFADVLPGDYMLTNAVAGTPAWRLRVSLAKGERLVLDLSPANLTTIRDDFPEPRS